jgi:type IV pilus assembly protein PilE
MTMSCHTQRRAAGFTLVELMIVIVIVAILASIAIPTYQSSVRKSRRTEVKTAVLDLAAREEKYFSLNNAYTNSPANLGYASAGAGTTFPVSTGTYYTISACPSATAVTAAASSCGTTASGAFYVIVATPVAGQSQTKDTQCLYWALDNTGAQFASSATSAGGADTTATCWQ